MSVRKVFVFGANGALGKTIVNTFKKSSWNVYACDVVSGGAADKFAIITANERFDAIVNVSGGFAMGPAGTDEYLNDAERMISSSASSAILSTHLAAKALKPNGTIILTGANAATFPTGAGFAAPYAASKAFVQHLTVSLKNSPKDCGIPESSTVAAIVPIMLNTPANASAMPDADKSTWTDLGDISEWVVRVCEGKTKPDESALVRVETKDHKTTFKGF